MGEQKFTIGKSPECDIVLANTTVSRRHAELIYIDDGKLLLTDCRSRNGTWLQKEGSKSETRVSQAFISPSDILRFGKQEISVKDLMKKISLHQGANLAKPNKKTSGKPLSPQGEIMYSCKSCGKPFPKGQNCTDPKCT